MAVDSQTSPDDSALVENSAAYQLKNEPLEIPPRPDWLAKKEDAPAQKTPIPKIPKRNRLEMEDIRVFLKRREFNFFLYLFDIFIHPLRHLAQISGLGISLALHGCLLLVLAFITLQSGTFSYGNVTLISGDDGEDYSISHIDTSIAAENTPQVMQETSLAMPVIPSSIEKTDTIITKSDDIIQASVFEQKSTASDPNPFKGAFAPPAGSKVVSSGSFSAYTVPPDPEPEQDYYIVILIKAPKGMDKYPTSDITGKIEGTDGWEQPIIDQIFSKRNKYLDVKDELAQIVVKVPGAYKLVKDRINIRSKILKENQRLEIEF